MPSTVLVVDDEPVVLNYVRHVLERRGYSVLAARDAPKAKALCEASPQTISLVITDIQMPAMNGREFAKCLGKSHPGVPVLFMTGYILDSEYKDALTGQLRLDGHSIMRKPFRPDELIEAVETLLRSKSVSAAGRASH